jgi:para-nitrobenzyl esterase
VSFAESKGAHSLAELRALPAARFFEPSTSGGGTRLPNGPFNDGWVLTASVPSEQVPLMVGLVADDIGVSGGAGPGSKADVEGYQADARRIYGEQADAFLKLYPAAADADVIGARKAAGRDRARVSMDLWADGQSRASKRIFTYFFDRVIPWPAHPEFGAFHTSEVPYVFETINRLDRPWEPVDHKLAETVSSYWANFGRTGDPNGAGLPPWLAYSSKSRTTMELGPRVGAMSVADPPKFEFFLNQLKK